MSETAPTEKKAPRIGRRVALGVVWVGIFYMAVMGFYSLIPQVFMNESQAQVPEDLDCPARLRTMKQELLHQSTTRLANMGRSEEQGELEEWLADWDDRLLSLDRPCGETHGEAMGNLSTLRHRLEATVTQAGRTLGPLSQRIDDAIGTDPPRTPIPTEHE